MKEVFYLTNIEQMHGIADPIRICILDRLVREPAVWVISYIP